DQRANARWASRFPARRDSSEGQSSSNNRQLAQPASHRGFLASIGILERPVQRPSAFNRRQRGQGRRGLGSNRKERAGKESSGQARPVGKGRGGARRR